MLFVRGPRDGGAMNTENDIPSDTVFDHGKRLACPGAFKASFLRRHCGGGAMSLAPSRAAASTATLIPTDATSPGCRLAVSYCGVIPCYPAGNGRGPRKPGTAAARPSAEAAAATAVDDGIAADASRINIHSTAVGSVDDRPARQHIDGAAAEHNNP
jgi:hypothetical protein